MGPQQEGERRSPRPTHRSQLCALCGDVGTWTQAGSCSAGPEGLNGESGSQALERLPEEPPPQSLSSQEWGVLPALGWCPLPASTVPSTPGPGWSLVQEEKLQKTVSAPESQHLTKKKPPMQR